MKKLIALLLALVMVLSMVACGSSEEPAETTAAPAETAPAQEETTPVETEAPDSDEEDEEVLSNEEALAICLGMLGDSLNLDNYDEPEVEDGKVYLYQSEDIESELDYVVTIMEDLDICLDGVTTCQDLTDAGFAFNFPETVEGLNRYSGTCKHESGAWFTSTIVNPNEGAKPVGECYVTMITVIPQYVGDFEVNGINASSTIADVIAAYGEPYYVRYSQYRGLSIQFHDEISGAVAFAFTDDGVLDNVMYSYNDYNLVS